MFEYIYFARPDLIAGGRSVYDVRKAIGAELARESHIDCDVIVPVPDSGVPAAIGLQPAFRRAVRTRHHPQPLCRAHLHSSRPRASASSASA